MRIMFLIPKDEQANIIFACSSFGRITKLKKYLTILLYVLY